MKPLRQDPDGGLGSCRVLCPLLDQRLVRYIHADRRTYVQRVEEASPSPAAAAAVIESAFMTVRKAPKRTFPDLSARNADVSGKVLFTARAAAPRAVYYWEVGSRPAAHASVSAGAGAGAAACRAMAPR